jgi:hypothetical protein
LLPTQKYSSSLYLRYEQKGFKGSIYGYPLMACLPYPQLSFIKICITLKNYYRIHKLILQRMPEAKE